MGEKELLVTCGDPSFETDSLVITKRTETNVQVGLIGDTLVVKSNGRVLAEEAVKRKNVTDSTTGKNAGGAKSDGAVIEAASPTTSGDDTLKF